MSVGNHKGELSGTELVLIVGSYPLDQPRFAQSKPTPDPYKFRIWHGSETAASSDQHPVPRPYLPVMKFSNEGRCPRCKTSDVRPSRKRTFLERIILPLFFHRPFRCNGCFRRFYGRARKERFAKMR